MQTKPLPQEPLLAHRILMTGGHEQICGGLEIFIARARACLGIADHHYTETPGAGGLGHYLLSLLHFVRRLRAYDIVWLHYGSLFDLAYLLLAKALGKKVVVTPHLGAGWRSMRNTALRTACNRILLAADTVFTLYKSQAQALQFPPALSRRCQVMGTFLPPELLASETPPRHRNGPLKIVHVARLSREKGSFAFLDVCAELQQRGVAFEAAMIGPASDATRQALAAEISHHGLAITMRGALCQDDLMAELRCADVLVNLSLQDAYPLTVIEALLCGVVPVCSILAGTEELQQEAPSIVLIEGQYGAAAAEKIASLAFDSVPASASALRHKFSGPVLQRRYQKAFAALLPQPRPIHSDAAIKVITP